MPGECGKVSERASNQLKTGTVVLPFWLVKPGVSLEQIGITFEQLHKDVKQRWLYDYTTILTTQTLLTIVEVAWVTT